MRCKLGNPGTLTRTRPLTTLTFPDPVLRLPFDFNLLLGDIEFVAELN